MILIRIIRQIIALFLMPSFSLPNGSEYETKNPFLRDATYGFVSVDKKQRFFIAICYVKHRFALC